VQRREFLSEPLDLHSATRRSPAGIRRYTLESPLVTVMDVWLAPQRRQFEGHAAVKLLNPLIGHPSARRFAREASVLANFATRTCTSAHAGVAGAFNLLHTRVRARRRIDEYCEQNALGLEQRIELFLEGSLPSAMRIRT